MGVGGCLLRHVCAHCCAFVCCSFACWSLIFARYSLMIMTIASFIPSWSYLVQNCPTASFGSSPGKSSNSCRPELVSMLNAIRATRGGGATPAETPDGGGGGGVALDGVETPVEGRVALSAGFSLDFGGAAAMAAYEMRCGWTGV